MTAYSLSEDARGLAMSLAGADGEALFRDAAACLAAALVDPATVSGGGLRDKIRVEAADMEGLLDRWVTAILYQFSANRFVLAGAHRLRLASAPGKWALEADLDGEMFDPGRHGQLREIPPAAPRTIVIEKKPAGLAARIFFPRG